MIDIKHINTINWSQQKVAVLGAGKSGIASAKLAESIGASVLLSDNGQVEISNLDNIEVESGGHSIKVLECDLLVISPGISDKISIVKSCIEKQIPVVSEIEFASWFTTSPILAITGSNGKTTATTLLHHIVKNSGYTSLLGGNIGIPFSENVKNEKENNLQNVVHVLELSSFQLEHIHHFSPLISCILNISPDHLNRYDSMDDYIKAKLNIAKNLVAPAWLVYNADDSVLDTSLRDRHRTQLFSRLTDQQVHYQVNSEKVYSQNSTPLFFFDETELQGPHNIENILAVSTMANLFGIEDEQISQSIKAFKTISHRMEVVNSSFNFKIINDSKATNIAAAKAAIESFDNITLILGGEDKGQSDFSELINSIQKHVNQIVCYGKSGEYITKSLQKIGDVSFTYNFVDAVTTAIEKTNDEHTLLFSPACASFDQFASYEERGDEFKKIIAQLEVEKHAS